MAFQKPLKKFGVEANYLSLTRIDHFDRLARSAVFIFSLYKDEETARLPPSDPQAEPLVGIAAKLRLREELFDKYFGPGVKNRDAIIAQAYLAARVEQVEHWGGRLELKDAKDA